MATSEPVRRVFDFLGRNANIGGTCFGLAAGGVSDVLLGATLQGVALPVVLGIGAVGYLGGYLLFGQSRRELDFDLARNNSRVEVASIQRNIDALRARISEAQRDLPTEITQRTDNLFEMLEEILPKWEKLGSFAEQKYTVNAILTDYLPQILTNYLNLPKSYYRNANKRQLGVDIQEQLDTLVKAVSTIRDGVYEGVEQDIKTQGAFLQSRFVDNRDKLLQL